MNFENELIKILDSDKKLLFELYRYADFQFIPYEERPLPMDDFNDIMHGSNLLEIANEAVKNNFDINNDYFIESIYGIQSISNIYDYVVNNADYVGCIYDIALYYSDVENVHFESDGAEDFLFFCRFAFEDL